LIHHHRIVRALSLLQVSQFLAGKGISAMDHPLYSLDLASADFQQFPKLKESAERKEFLGR
jgi:hypothetical protein